MVDDLDLRGRDAGAPHQVVRRVAGDRDEPVGPPDDPGEQRAVHEAHPRGYSSGCTCQPRSCTVTTQRSRRRSAKGRKPSIPWKRMPPVRGNRCGDTPTGRTRASTGWRAAEPARRSGRRAGITSRTPGRSSPQRRPAERGDSNPAGGGQRAAAAPPCRPRCPYGDRSGAGALTGPRGSGRRRGRPGRGAARARGASRRRTAPTGTGRSARRPRAPIKPRARGRCRRARGGCRPRWLSTDSGSTSTAASPPAPWSRSGRR